MRRLLAQLLLVLAPLGCYVWWLLAIVGRELARGERLGTVLMMLAGLLALAVVEGLIFKLYLLPCWARSLSERLYGGNYFPEDDPLARLARKIDAEQRPELIPEFIRLVEADPCRVRAWLELARLLADHDAPQAVQRLLQGADILAARRRSHSQREDAALLLWRAATLSQKHPELAAQAPPILQRLASQYPDTAYGKLALKKAGK